MDQGDIMSVFYNAMILTLKIAGPLLIASIVVGLVVAIFQAATQVHEQTLTFVPKLIVIAVILLLMGTTMMKSFNEFFVDIFHRIGSL
jgi:flagellar biosynthetic protein FliQ